MRGYERTGRAANELILAVPFHVIYYTGYIIYNNTDRALIILGHT